MANVIIDQFGDAIVNWIRNGFEGSPMFLSDPEGFFSDMANQASGAIIDDLNMEWLCDPLGKLRIDLDFFLPGTDRAKYRCTFNDVAGNFKDIAGRKDLSDWIDINVNMHEQNIVRLYGSDYRQGGLLMWLFTAQKKNNDMGRTIQTASDAFTAARVSVNFGKFNLFKNGGFLGMRKCVEYEDIPLEEGGLMTTSKCLKYVDTTPGQLVQDQLNQAAGGDLKRLHIADEVDEIIGALASTMVANIWMFLSARRWSATNSASSPRPASSPSTAARFRRNWNRKPARRKSPPPKRPKLQPPGRLELNPKRQNLKPNP